MNVTLVSVNLLVNAAKVISVNVKMKKDKFKELAGDFKNEADLEEELDEEGLDKDEVEKQHFEEEDEKDNGKNN